MNKYIDANVFLECRRNNSRLKNKIVEMKFVIDGLLDTVKYHEPNNMYIKKAEELLKKDGEK